MVKRSWPLGLASRNVAVDEKSKPVREVSEKDPWLEARTFEKSWIPKMRPTGTGTR